MRFVAKIDSYVFLQDGNRYMLDLGEGRTAISVTGFVEQAPQLGRVIDDALEHPSVHVSFGPWRAMCIDALVRLDYNEANTVVLDSWLASMLATDLRRKA